MQKFDWTHVDMEFVEGSEDPAEGLFLIDGILSTSATLVSGLPKSGKTTFTTHMITAALTADHFLDRKIHGRPHRAFWLGGDPDWATEFDNSVAKGVPGWLRMDASSSLSQRLRSSDRQVMEETWTDFGSYLESLGVTILVIDSLTAFAGQYGTDKIQEVQPFLNLLTAIIDRGISVTLIAHSAKGFGNQKQNRGKPGGSAALAAWRRVGIEFQGDGTVTRNRKVTVLGNRVAQTEFTFRELTPTNYALQSAADKMTPPLADETDQGSPTKRERDRDAMQVRARALVDAPADARRNASTAGSWLAEHDPREGITSAESGRQTVTTGC